MTVIPLRVEGARVLLPSGLERVAVTLEDGVVAALDAPAGDAEPLDARGLLLAPALVDIHGDAFERQLMPRPGVRVPVAAAMLETDRQLAANGIAIAYHALTLSWEPGLRSLATAEEMAVGKRADLVPIDWPEGDLPVVRATLSAGRLAYRALSPDDSSGARVRAAVR